MSPNMVTKAPGVCHTDKLVLRPYAPHTRKKSKFIRIKNAFDTTTCPLFERFRAAPLQVRAVFLCHYVACVNIPHDALCCVVDHRPMMRLQAATHQSAVLRTTPTGWRQRVTATSLYAVDTRLPRVVRKITRSGADCTRKSVVMHRWGPFRVSVSGYGDRLYEAQSGQRVSGAPMVVGKPFSGVAYGSATSWVVREENVVRDFFFATGGGVWVRGR